MDGDRWMDGRMARRKRECGGRAGVGEWTGWMDGGRCMDGWMARRTSEWSGKVGVGELTEWMDGWMGGSIICWIDGKWSVV